MDYLDDQQFDDEELKSKPVPSSRKRKNAYYVNKAELCEEIRKYQESAKKSPDGVGIVSEELMSMIIKICTKFSLHSKFIRIFLSRRICR